MAETVSLVSHPDLSERTYQIVRADILSGRLQPGSRLVIVDLANRLGVSRTPVADALNRLLGEGYVTEVARKGYFVAGVNADDLAELMEAAIVIHQGAVERGINLARVEQVAEMRRLLDEAENLVDEDGSYRDYEQFLRLGRDFHMLVVGSGQNRYLTDMYAMLSDRGAAMRAKWTLESDSNKGLDAVREHQVILAAIERKDLAAAKAAIAGHFRAGEESFLRAFGSSPTSCRNEG